MYTFNVHKKPYGWRKYPFYIEEWWGEPAWYAERIMRTLYRTLWCLFQLSLKSKGLQYRQ